MKLRTIEITTEDVDAWYEAMHRPEVGPAQDRAFKIMTAYRDADRRDAEVMNRLGTIRHRFYVASVMMLGRDKPTAPDILAAATRHGRDPGRAFELDYRPPRVLQ